MTRVTDIANEAHERTSLALMGMAAAITALAEGASPLRSASYDTEKPSPVPWCWDHERPVNVCHRSDLGCAGEVIEAHDPTGERATSPNPQQAMLRAMERAWRAILVEADRLITMEQQLQARVLTASERSSVGECEACGHHCDGSANDRLRTVDTWKLCDRCRMARTRERKASA